MNNLQPPSRLLLVEDEKGIAIVIADLLRGEGHTVEAVADGETGLQRALTGNFDLLILDVMLPGINGYEICKRVREHGFEGAILMLTARAQVNDRVEGLRKGADDYLIKPFSPEELAARAHALLRRVHKKGVTPVVSYKFGDVEIDFSQMEIVKNGQPLSLTGKEWELLRFLINNRGQILSRDAILAKVWGEQKFITPRTVDVHIAWLRQKLEKNPQSPRHILTIRGEGYRFVV
jgi:two-component system alkaline phosphatase synthesis response regulator PhoP